MTDLGAAVDGAAVRRADRRRRASEDADQLRALLKHLRPRQRGLERSGERTEGRAPAAPNSYDHASMQGDLAVTGDPDADRLVNTDPLALLRAMMLDQHMR